MNFSFDAIALELKTVNLGHVYLMLKRADWYCSDDQFRTLNKSVQLLHKKLTYVHSVDGVTE